MSRLLAFVVGFVFVLACGPQHPPPPAPPPCAPDAVRCDGETLALCASDGAWTEVQRCPDVRPLAHCVPTPDSARCVLDGPVQLATLTRELTAEDVASWGLWVERAFGAVLHNSLDADSPIAVLNDHLAALGILEPDAYRTSFAATVGRAIFAPFALGESHGQWTLPVQVRVLGHEATHVVEFYREGAHFVWNYVARPPYRARAEAAAYSADQEVGWHLFRDPPSPEGVYDSLGSYHLPEADRRYAWRYVALRALTTAAGGCSSRACTEALAWARWRGLLPAAP